MKLEVIVGQEFTADFTVISDDGVTGEILDPSDTATFTVSTSGISPVCTIPPVDMTIVDADNGLFSVTLTKEQTSLLVQEVGFAEDDYPTQSNYIALLDFTLVSGNRPATMPLYVREIGLPCLVK